MYMHTSQRLSEEGDVGGLVVGNLLEVVIENLVEASLLEILKGEVRKTLAVELVL
jgi:hypothetical protein